MGTKIGDAVVVAAPLARVVEHAPADDRRTGRHHLGEHLAAGPRRLEVRIPADRIAEPLVQALTATAEALAGVVVGPAINPSSDMDM